ncbi:MAG: LacI family DNA-binding transcriptional regulator [Clostridia bacterium]|nr:LacI family DNA-binding transcriptional regulator [Clostridia bacterium]
MAATIKDIAKETGLSLATISKYLNGGNVLPQNRELIKKAVAKLGYQVNLHARALKSGSTGAIGVLVAELNSSLCSSAASIAEGFLREKGYTSLVCNIRSHAAIEEQLLRFCADQRVDGILSLPINVKSPAYAHIMSMGIPLVLVSNPADCSLDVSRTCISCRDALIDLVTTLKLNGHRRIGVITSFNKLPSCESSFFFNDSREADIKGIFESCGLEWNEDLHYNANDFDPECGYIAARELMSRNPRPTALLCINNDLLLGAYVSLLRMQYRIPEDVSFCGVSSVHTNKIHSAVNFSMVNLPIESYAKASVDLLLSLINDPIDVQSARTVCFKAKFHSGATIAPVTNNDF